MSVLAPTPEQRRAADPSRSVWVTANAGTGKTSVLTDRTLRLMLAGAEPESILCLTFTKAAAAEMTLRVERRLASWATHPDDELAAELEALTGEVPGPATSARARQLFARVLDLPRGLLIMTVHGFCGALLRRFPVEAGVPAHFEPIDERTAAELMEDARAAMLKDARDADSPVGQALSKLAVMLADTSLGEALTEILRARVRLARKVDAAGGIDALVAILWARLEVAPQSEPIMIERAFCENGVDHGALAEAGRVLAGKKGRTQADGATVIVGWLAATPEDRLTALKEYRATFLTQKGELSKRLVSEALRRDHPDVAAALEAECRRLQAMEERRRALMLGRRTEALVRVGWRVIEHYEVRKRRQASLDFDDLIERTRLLLDRGSAWVLYKLDQRIEHLLVDEAQDTSPSQWEIALQLSGEFFAGSGQHQGPRTLFVVGDEKQSIYSFQGADLANLHRVRALLEAQVSGPGTDGAVADEAGGLVRSVLDRSFRSTRAVLDLVDGVLALPEARGGLVAAGATVHHDTARPNDAGLVELWPLAVAPERSEEDADPWPLPGAVRRTDEPERAVARAIAATIRGWLDRGERLAASGARIGAGDIMILLSRRGTAQEHLIRALKQAGLPVAGADRLALTGHIAVQDLVALGRAVLLPEDDLTFACLLKSPLVGLDDDDLMRLAADRGPSSLLERLRSLAAGDPRLGPALTRIEGWLAQADFMPPFEFFCRVLGPEGGRRRLLARLGREAQEPIEAFLGQCLAYEAGHPASLEGFLHWLMLGQQELKRDPEGAADAVRVLTVHGAKGLEAPVVFLADAGPHGRSPVHRLIWDEGTDLPLWRAASGDREALSQAAVQAEEERDTEERRRLLYVALTRARDRLYITGWRGRRAKSSSDADEAKPAAWHELCAAALDRLDGVVEVEQNLGAQFQGPIRRYARGVAGTVIEPVPALPAEAPLPPWARTPAPAEPPAVRPLAPSHLVDEAPAHGALAGADAAARIRRGQLIHKLLELLPDLPEAARSGPALRWLARTAPDLPDDERRTLVDEVVAVLTMPELAAAFGPGSRAEQGLCGTIDGRPFSGQVDRLAVTDDAVIVVDYKTGRVPPAGLAMIPEAYLRQMATYGVILRELWPGREIRAGLLWTQAPRLDRLPAALLAAHLQHLPSAGRLA